MDYNHISGFLDKFKTILFKKDEHNRVIVEVIKKYINTEIDIKNIKTKGTTIYINSSPLVHNEILIHKNKIISDISSLIPEANFKEIR